MTMFRSNKSLPLCEISSNDAVKTHALDSDISPRCKSYELRPQCMTTPSYVYDVITHAHNSATQYIVLAYNYTYIAYRFYSYTLATQKQH